MPAFQPYRGKPAVRNVRGDRGNVGIIRSPVRASILPDLNGHRRFPKNETKNLNFGVFPPPRGSSSLSGVVRGCVLTKTGDTERRLVAIFAADVEGYSRLMGADEVGTLKDLTQRRDILDGLIASRRGRISSPWGQQACWRSLAAPSMPFSAPLRRRRRFPKLMWAGHLTVTSIFASALDRAQDLRQRRRGVAQEGGAQVQPGRAIPGHRGKLRDRGGGTRIRAAVRDGYKDLLRGGTGGSPPPGGQQGPPVYAWMPHSVLPVPAHRPLRGSAPGSTRSVQVAQPIDG